jgi:hypothetical protein
MNNLFERAVTSNELLEFAHGKPPYFIQDREYGDHWILESWRSHVLPYLDSNTSSGISDLTMMFKALLNDRSVNFEDKIRCILYHVHVIYYLHKNGSLSDIAFFQDTEGLVVDELRRYRDNSLQKDSLMQIEKAISIVQSNGGLLAY